MSNVFRIRKCPVGANKTEGVCCDEANCQQWGYHIETGKKMVHLCFKHLQILRDEINQAVEMYRARPGAAA